MPDAYRPLHPRNYRVAVSIFFFIAGFTFASWASRIPDIKASLQLSDAGLGGVLFSLPVGLMVSMPFSGYLVTRFGSRQIVLLAALFYPVALVGLALAPTVWLLSAGLFIFGFWGNLFNISVNTQAVSVEALYGRSIMASFHGLWSLAGFAGAATGTLMIALKLPPFLHFCIIWLTTAALVLFFYKNTFPHKTPTAAKPLFAKPDKTLLKLGFIAFGCLVCEGTMFDWSGVYFQKVVKAEAGLVTIGYVAFMGAMATGRFIADWLVTKTGITTLLRGSGLLICVGLLVAVIFPNLFAATFGFMVVGFGVSAVVPVVYGLAGMSTTTQPGIALAAVSTIGFLGFLVGPPLVGLLAEWAGLRLSFTVIAIIGCGTALLAGSIRTAP